MARSSLNYVVFLDVSLLAAALQLNWQDNVGMNSQEEGFSWPVFYLHIPKTAGGFATSVLHSACAGCVDDNAKVIIGGLFQPGACCSNKFARFDGVHWPLDGDDFRALPEPRLSHVVSLFREPRQRLMSGFYHNRHDCGYLKTLEAPDCLGDDNTQAACAPLLNAATSENVEKYAQCVGSCTYNMMTMSVEFERNDYCGPYHQTKEEFDEAPVNSTVDPSVLRQIDEFGFVGLADEYELSVCLWHVRFGTPCLPIEFSNLRPGAKRQDSHYSEDLFSHKIDEMMASEHAIYNKAKERFHRELRQHGVTRSKCSEVCPEPAEVWAVDASSKALELIALPRGSFELDWPGRKAFDVE